MEFPSWGYEDKNIDKRVRLVAGYHQWRNEANCSSITGANIKMIRGFFDWSFEKKHLKEISHKKFTIMRFALGYRFHLV